KISDHTIRFVELDELARTSDIVSLHLPLNQDTHQIINQEFLSKMKSDSILINTARGGLIDENALYDVLAGNGSEGAGFGVLTVEPAPLDPPLLPLPNCITPGHKAWAPLDARLRLMEQARKNIETFIAQGSISHALT